jgi:tRNA G18 (ribose-2'-O)-methylase SpoU
VSVTHQKLNWVQHQLHELLTFDQFDRDGWEWLHPSTMETVAAAIYFSTAIAAHQVLSPLDSFAIPETLARLIDCVKDPIKTISTAAQLAANARVRWALKAFHSVLAGFVGSASCRFPCSTQSPALVRTLMNIRPQTSVIDVPCRIVEASSSIASIQVYRYIYNSIHFLCRSSERCFTIDMAEAVQDYALSSLDTCGVYNLSAVYDLLSWCLEQSHRHRNPIKAEGSPPLPPRLSPELTVRCMLARLEDAQRKEYFKCASVALYSLRHCDDKSFVVQAVSKILANEIEAQRIMFFASTAVAFETLQGVDNVWEAYKPVLLHIAVLYNCGHDDDELEASLAVLEPLVSGWSWRLRADFPPSVRLSSVARSLAISAILYACQCNAERAVELSKELILWNTTNKIVRHEPCMPGSAAHRSRIRLWQLLCGLIPLLPTDSNLVSTLVDLVVEKCFALNNMGSVRRFMELYLFGVMRSNPMLYSTLADKLSDYSTRPQICGSYALVAVHMMLQYGDVYPQILADLLPHLMRLSTSNQHLLRIISHIGIFELRPLLERHGFMQSAEMKKILDYISRAPECVKMREKNYELVIFAMDISLDPRHLFCTQRKEANTWLREASPPISFDRLRFLHKELACILGATAPFDIMRTDYLSSLCANGAVAEKLGRLDVIPHANPACVTDHFIDYTLESLVDLAAREDIDVMARCTNETSADQDDPQVARSKDPTALQSNMQRKVTSWWASEAYNELHPRALGSNERQHLIVVGSLLENPVNIAGLCRCGDIFCVEKIIIPDQKVFAHPHFVAAARSSELWVPWEEVLPVNLPEYLYRIRQEGFTIVGIEQTASSVPMPHFSFPSNSVVVLGSEGQGIPAPLLPLLDVCVEIPQYGLIRSLNVHVTGAIVIYEYTRQHLMQSNRRGSQHPRSGPSETMQSPMS